MVRYWCIQFVDDREILHLYHTIPIWLLGVMERRRAERHDLYSLQPVTQAEAVDFIAKFEASERKTSPTAPRSPFVADTFAADNCSG